MSQESEDSPEVERQALNPSNSRPTSTPSTAQLQGNNQPPSGDTNRPFFRIAGRHHLATPIPSPTRSIQREIVSPRPRLPSSISTLLNQSELCSPPLNPVRPQRGRESSHLDVDIRFDQACEYSGIHSTRLISFVPHSHLDRTFRHSPLVAVAPPPLLKPSTGTAHGGMSAVFLIYRKRRLDKYYLLSGRNSLWESPMKTIQATQGRSIEDHTHKRCIEVLPIRLKQVGAPLSEGWMTEARTPSRDRSGWTQSEIARYQEGYNDAMSVMLSGTGIGGADAGHRINMHDRRQTVYQQPVISVHPHPTVDVPPPQPPQVYHQQPRYRNESLRIDPSLQRPATHRRQSQSSSNIPTPTVSTPLNKVHPPPASDYFGRAFHHSHPGSSDHPPAKRPKRQQISCYPCRQRKLRCDGKTPCAQCSRRHIDGQCRYADRIRRRGRGKKVNEEEQGTGDSEEHDDEGEEIHPAESSMTAQRRVGGASLHEEERDEIDGDMSLDSALESGSRPSGIGSPGRYPSSGPADEGQGEVEEKEY
ncbi:uncharacterized protein L199_008207 [Kwoniella botswanensis]|uniref:uncharacterized protein n=1 Tax=Kwoniella botswanensis TaxID=1268659 RepID=UPI00315CADBA